MNKNYVVFFSCLIVVMECMGAAANPQDDLLSKQLAEMFDNGEMCKSMIDVVLATRYIPENDISRVSWNLRMQCRRMGEMAFDRYDKQRKNELARAVWLERWNGTLGRITGFRINT